MIHQANNKTNILTSNTLPRPSHLDAGGASRLARAAGRFEGLDQLEQRILLGGDHPSFGLPLNSIGATPITVTAGVGSATGIINPALDDDVFQFVAPSNELVSIWADTLSGASALNSRVEVYTEDALLVKASSNDGTLTGGLFTDGRAVFKAEAGTTYYVRVLSDVTTGTGSTGAYSIRVNAAINMLTFDGLGTNTTVGSVDSNGSDVLYKITTGSGSEYNTVGMVYAATGGTLDPRFDIYDGDGILIKGDSQTGRLNDPFAVVRSDTDTTYYIRLRGDEFASSSTAATGTFQLRLDFTTTNIAIDHVTRTGTGGGAAGGSSAVSFDFLAQGTGLSILTMIPSGLVPIADPALRVYNRDGELIGFSDDANGVSAEVQIQLTGGVSYYLVSEDFDNGGTGTFTLALESNHTFNTTIDVDDHADLPDLGGTQDEIRRGFENATPITWSDQIGSIIQPVSMANMAYIRGTQNIEGAVYGQATGRIHNGGDTDVFMFVPPVDMLGDWAGFEDPDPITVPPPLKQWQAQQRPSGRLQLVLNATTGSFLSAPQLRVYDADFNLVGTASALVNPIVGSPAPTTANSIGFLNPAYFEPGPLVPPILGPDPFTYAGGEPEGIEIWAGYPYFIEVAGASTGRYEMVLAVDAMPPDDTSGLHPDPFNSGAREDYWQEVRDAGAWSNATKITQNANTGDANVVGATNGLFDFSAGGERARMLGATGATGFNIPPWPGLAVPLGATGILEEGLYHSIERIDDIDLFRFTANADGSAELRINTTDLADSFAQVISDFTVADPMSPPMAPTVSTVTKTIGGDGNYSSWLHSSLRIFNNDFEEIAFNGFNTTIDGESESTTVGSNTRTFWGRDASVSFNVEAGKTYFVQVESGQLAAYQAAIAAASSVQANADFSLVDWTHATGSYELLLNTMTNLNFDDDHENINGVQSTVIPIDPSSGAGTIAGVIDNTLANPTDTDSFLFRATATGIARITVETTSGLLVPSVTVVDRASAQIVAQASATTPGLVTVTIPVIQGEEYFVAVGSTGVSEGGYNLTVSDLPAADDHANDLDFSNATVVPVLDFVGSGVEFGSIEEFGDSDVFVFTTAAFDVASIQIASLTNGFNPTVRVYEIGLDTARTMTSAVFSTANPIPLQIAFDIDDDDGVASTNFSIRAPDRTPTTTAQNNTFNSYYIVVTGTDVNLDRGNYQLLLSLTPTDDHPDAGEWQFATPVSIVPSTGDGDADGIIEVDGDTDLFKFISPAGGTAVVSVTSPATSSLRPAIRIFDANQNPIADINTSAFVRQGSDATISSATFTFNAQRNSTYFVQIEGVSGGSLTTSNGAYTIDFGTPTVDDHANITEFSLASEIVLNATNGDGQGTGILEIGTDTDIFFFDSLVTSAYTISIVTPASDFNPVVRIYNESQTLTQSVTDGGTGDLDGLQNGAVVVSVTTATVDERSFVLVSSDQGQIIKSGAYLVQIEGAAPTGGGPIGSDDHANAGQWTLATAVLLSGLNGDANVTGQIGTSGDTDLFTFTSLASGKAFIDIQVPDGALLDASITIFNSSFQQIAFDTEGLPGSDAYVAFNTSAPGAQYFVLVDGIGAGTGSYSVRFDTEPSTHYLYFPEGFAADQISEFVSIINPNSTSVSYTITAYFENTSLTPVAVGSGSIGAGLRSGATLSDRFSGGSTTSLPENAPYSLVITSTGMLGATFAHYDFGLSIGESFTGQTSTTWSFAQVERNPGSVNDFVVFFNPNTTAATVTMNVYTSSGVVKFAKNAAANSRGGWSIDDIGVLPVGVYGITVTSQAANGSSPHVGVVVSQSHYDTSAKSGYSQLGDATGGSTRGAIPAIIFNDEVSPEIHIFNPSASPATVTFNGDYISSGLPNFVRIFNVQPRSSLTISASALGVVDDQPIGLSYTSEQSVTVDVVESRSTDSNGSLASTQLATNYFFGDGFINADSAGTVYLETLSFHNPDATALSIQVKLYFSDGDEFTTSVNVGANSFAQLSLHDLQIFQQRGGLNFFSIETSASRPFAVNFVHYDLFLGGGFGTAGAPLGLLTNLASI